MLELLGYASGVIGFLCFVPYIRDIFKGTTKPERATWLIWSVLGGIAFFSQYAEGASHSLWMTSGQTLGVLIVFALSIKYGMGGLSRRDIVSLALAGIGLLIWYLTQHAVFALIIVIFVDALGLLLTTLKTYEYPETETLSTWVLAGIAGLLGTLAVGSLDPTLLAYPVYIFLANVVMVSIILIARRRRGNDRILI